MKITKTSELTGKTRSLDLPVTRRHLNMIDKGRPIQKVLPHLNEDQRMFILSGVTPDEWNELMGKH